MVDVAKVRELLEVMRELAPVMTDDEISDIGLVLMRVTNRLLNESEEN
ncbi:hypothetical protein K144312032_14520 [Clostridium tetani]|nr:hypothetical protein [Clostridium tetani]BDR67224.1 hypothetical protein K144312032_14520 [Clostridium tetani]